MGSHTTIMSTMIWMSRISARTPHKMNRCPNRYTSFPTYCFLFACVLFAIVVVFLPVAAASRSAAVQGVLDLSQWNFADGHVMLDGEWEFYWRRWIDPGAFTADQADDGPLYVSVPGTWSQVVADGRRLPPHGFGTYRLRVLLGEPRGPLSLALRSVDSAFNLWVNGRQVVQHGVPHQDGTQERPGGGTVTIGVGADHTELDIVLHISNHTFRDGGMRTSIVLGDSSMLMVDYHRSLTINVVLVASLFVIGLYHLGVWAIRPSFFHALYLGLFCLVLSARTAMMDQAPITFFLTQLNREWLLKVEYLGFYLGGALLALFLRAMYPREIKKQTVHVVVMVSWAFAVAVLVTPGRFNSHLVLYYEVFAVAEFLYLVYCLLRAVRRKRDGARLLTAATVLFFFVFIHDIFYFWGFLRTRHLAPIAILGLVLAYSFTLAKRFLNELERQRILSEQNMRLVDTVRRQMEEIKESRRLMHEREENTRRSLADLLHGTVQSRLLSAGHFLQKAVSTLTSLSGSDGGVRTAREHIEKASSQIDQSREEIREISHMLHPTLISMGLVPAIRTLLQRFEGQFAMELEVTGDLETTPTGEEGIERGIRLIAYRIVEEALNNVVKHAEATRVHVALDVTDGLLTLEVRDDGQGIPPGTGGQGVGLEMIATRVEEVNGSIQLDSSPGAGTRLRISIPLLDG